MATASKKSRRASGDPAVSALRRTLLRWFDERRRELPWRAPVGQLADPYAVWVSEVMLQQTQVAVVRDYFERWMARFPSVDILAGAREEEVLHLWQGLGYYSRARRLLQGARYIIEQRNGSFPRTVAELREVPGIGPYSAGAIASIAFGKSEAAVDGNVVRVLTRLRALPGDPARAPLARLIQQSAAELVPLRRPGDFNQALMELGATICLPRRPLCFDCPLRQRCAALERGEVERFPETRKKAPPTVLRFAVPLVERRGRWLLTQAPLSARWWHGLWHFPLLELGNSSDPERVTRDWLAQGGMEAETLHEVAPLVHSITRFRIELQPLLMRSIRQGETGGPRRLDPHLRWKATKQLEELPMPAPHRKLASRLRDLA